MENLYEAHFIYNRLFNEPKTLHIDKYECKNRF